jgi:Uma2 family endonuclease
VRRELIDLSQVGAVLTLGTSDQAVELDADRLQGSWTEEQYLRLSAATSRLLEYDQGRIEVLPAPTDEHQTLLRWLLLYLMSLIEPRGIVHVAPLRLRVGPECYREPDLLLLRDARDPRRRNEAWEGADLVIEIISPDDPERDTVTKRAQYAAASVTEYWLVDPRASTVTVLSLDGAVYREHGTFGVGTIVTSVLVPAVSFEVQALFAVSRPDA